MEPNLHLPRLLLGLVLTVAMFDICFWGTSNVGFSLTVFVLTLVGAILLNREAKEPRPTVRWLLTLLVVSTLGAAIETGVTNIIILVVLISALAGDTFFSSVESPWGRFLSQGVAMVRAPGRVFWLVGTLLQSAFGSGLGHIGGLVGGVLLVLPAILLAVIFGTLLASGNAVFGNWTAEFFDWLWKELALCLDPGRIVLWLLVALLTLPLLRPANVSAWWWSWTERLPRLPEMVPSRAATWSSGLVLVVLNFLFLVANSADALFLWSQQALPKGVTYSDFVHNGVNSLIVTVLLSAFVLAVIFQQETKVAHRRELKLLGMFWIAQNIFLLVSVVLRLKLYIEAYDMTVPRLSVVIFLILVALGYGLLALKIIQDRSLSWLIGGCALAVISSLYVAQFLDLAGWAANYNVDRWEKGRTRALDVRYLYDLGPAAWPALRRATNEGATWGEWADNDGETAKPMESAIKRERAHPRSQLSLADWREFSLRAWLNRGALDEKPNN